MLYIVGTPIGNIEDISVRAIKTLVGSSVILCEDTRAFDSMYSRVCKMLSIAPTQNQRIVAYHADNEFKLLPEILDMITSGKTVSLVSEAGMPIISDPGYLLVKKTIELDLPFTCIPGPTALTTAMVLAGCDSGNTLFLGFMSKKESEILSRLRSVVEISSIQKKLCVIFYESPHRINKTLHLMSSVMPRAQVTVCREMTKKFEEVVRGTPAELSTHRYKGEITVVISNIIG